MAWHEGLNERQRRFVEALLIKPDNITDAATAAGYSPRSAHVQAHRMLKSDKVVKALELARVERTKRVEVSADFVLTELIKLASACPEHFEVDKLTGDIKIKEGAPEGITAAISEVDKRLMPDGTWRVKFKLWSKPSALKMLAEHLGLLQHKVDITSKGEKIEPKQVIKFGDKEIEF